MVIKRIQQRPFGLCCCGLAMFVLAFCHAADAGEPPHRWGVGWDSGLGIRYMLGESWGLGFRVGSDVSLWSWKNGWTNWGHFGSVQLGGMVFYQVRAGKHLSFGPYGELQLDHTSGMFRKQFPYGVSNTYGVEIGIRPAFTFGKRFVLESRFGARLRYTSGWQWAPQWGGYERESIRQWELETVGEDLGPNAIVQFMIMF